MAGQRKSPEQKEKEAELKAAQALKAKEESQLYSRVFSTGEGKKVLAEIMKRCCYQNQIVVSTANGVDVNGTLHNAALQKHYVWLRSKINNEILRDVENPLE